MSPSAAARRDLVLLYPGAGTSADHPSLQAIADAVAPVACRREDFGYLRQGRRAPDRAPKLLAEVRDLVDTIGAAHGRIVLGGRSMGGRIGSMVAAGADGAPPPPCVAGLVLVAYPLHPPKQPDRLRVDHFVSIRVPCLFVSGTRDPFGTVDELEHWTATIPAPVTHHWVEGGRHDLRGADVEVAGVVARFVHDLLGLTPGASRPRG